MTDHARNTMADYHRHEGVTIRVSRLFDSPPVCLTCRRNDCEHVKTFVARVEPRKAVA